MATLTVQALSEAGITPAYASAAGGGDEFAVDTNERTFIHCKNTNGSTRTVTATAVKTSGKVKGVGVLTRANIAVVIPATTGDIMIGPFTEAFRNSSGRVALTYSATSGLTVGTFRLPRLTR